MRDKLIELIDSNKACDFEWECSECKYHDKTPCFAVRLADVLIANGVTFAADNNVGRKKPMTNADRIRSTDEELAKFICRHTNCLICGFQRYSECTLKDWLKQPAEVDHDN